MTIASAPPSARFVAACARSRPASFQRPACWSASMPAKLKDRMSRSAEATPPSRSRTNWLIVRSYSMTTPRTCHRAGPASSSPQHTQTHAEPSGRADVSAECATILNETSAVHAAESRAPRAAAKCVPGKRRAPRQSGMFALHSSRAHVLGLGRGAGGSVGGLGPRGQSPRLRDINRARASHGDDDLAPGVPFLEVPDGRRGFAERVGPVDGRCDLPCFEEFPEHGQVRRVLLRSEDAQSLTHQR
jgi:hypothetical protein